ncbi:hypothetical protein Ahy_A01g003595 isoform B [Arachis hypogaea]|uniref:Uncharacterized protein n=1 Tax=Arachis hypogaea TaxID=3818 RepID=A0A445ETA6_ARAHY|nr:hypothetical protein Ahy_A01g003595 isoform B [Arachis hypogaea]
MTLDNFLGEQKIHTKKEEEHIEVSIIEDARSRPFPNDGGNVDILHEKDYVGKYENKNFDVKRDQVIKIAHVELTVRKSREKIRCLKIYARIWKEKEEVTFDGGEVVGPTPHRVKNLTNFIGTMKKNSDFIILMTNEKVVPKQI